MQKVQPAKNNLDMDFLNSFNKPIGGTASAAAATPVQPAVTAIPEEAITEIDPTSNIESDFDTADISIDDEKSETDQTFEDFKQNIPLK